MKGYQRRVIDQGWQPEDLAETHERIAALEARLAVQPASAASDG
jgi:hypothetical protein